jgi:FkbM family methyltransferase
MSMYPLKAFSLKDRITLVPALFLRRLFDSASYRISKLVKHNISSYDLINQILASGLKADFSFNEEKTLLTLNFNSGCWNGTNLTIRTNGSDVIVLSQIFVEEEYKPLIDFISEKHSDETITSIVDAGANIGFTTIFLKKFFPAAKVVAIEPDKNNFALMENNFSGCGLKDITKLRAGIWDNETELVINRDFRDSLDWSIALREKENSDKTEVIKSITLPILRERYDMPKIDILKIDIEGSERFLFKDEKTAHQTLENVRFLALEIHNEFNICGKIENFLKQNGFTFFTKGDTCFAYKDK